MKNIKMLFVTTMVLVSIGLLFTQVTHAAITDYRLAITDGSGVPGETSIPISVNLTQAGADQIASSDLWFTYDASLLEAVSVEKGTLIGDWILMANTTIPGEVRIILYSAYPLLANTTGELVKVIFNVKATALPETTSTLHFTKAQLGGIPLPAGNVTDGSFSVVTPTYTITATAGSNGSISPSGEVVVTEGGSQTFTMTPSDGYHISALLVDEAPIDPIEAAYTFTNVTKDHKIHADFAINTYTLTLNIEGEGSVAKNPDQPSYEHGTQVTLTATPGTGYHFTSWSGNAAGDALSTTITMDSDKTVTAAFGITYGDVDASGEINSEDASIAAQYGVGLITLTPTQVLAADVDGSGEINAQDASLIAQHTVGLITKFPVEGE